MNIIKKIILSSVTLFSFIQAHIFEAEKWVNPSTQQALVLLGDYHISDNKDNQVNGIQKQNIISMAQELNATILVEDGYYNGEELRQNPFGYDGNKYRQLQLDNPNEITLLAGFTGSCQEQGVKVNNIEFRFPLSSVSAQTVIEKSEQIKARIATYNDPLLNDYYKQKLAELDVNVLTPCKELFASLKASTKKVEEIANSIEYKNAYDQTLIYLFGSADFTTNTEEKIKRIIIGYEARLFDLIALHEIAQTDGHIMLCAGSNHLKRIQPGLALLGFEKINEEGQTHFDGTQEPDALDMDRTLDAFYSEQEIQIAQQQAATSRYVNYMLLCVLLVIIAASSFVMIRHIRVQTEVQ